MPPGRRNNKIDKKEAELIGSVLVAVGQEIDEANSTFRGKVLKRADVSDVPEYHTIEDASMEYSMKMEIGLESDGVGKKRESEVTVRANYKKVSPNLRDAPFNVLFGTIAPAERNRDKILKSLKALVSGIQFPDDCPIYALEENKFWVVEYNTQSYFVIQLGNEDQVKEITSLDQLKDEIMPMHYFMARQINKSYGD